MNFRPILLAGLAALAGCATSHVSLGYQPAAGTPPLQSQDLVQIGKFDDARRGDPHRLGAIRGGFGNPVNTLETDAPVADVVRDSFAAGMKARGMLHGSADAPYILTATIRKFSCSQLVRREAHAIIVVTVTETASGRIVLTDTFRSDLIRNPDNAFDTDIFASPEDLRVMAVETLHDVIDAALDSPKLRQALAAGNKPS